MPKKVKKVASVEAGAEIGIAEDYLKEQLESAIGDREIADLNDHKSEIIRGIVNSYKDRFAKEEHIANAVAKAFLVAEWDRLISE